MLMCNVIKKSQRSSAHKEWSKEAVARLVRSIVRLKQEIISEGVENYHVFVAPVNKKGAPCSVSTIPVHDCGPNAKVCSGKCYDVRHDCIMKGVQRTRAINSAILEKDPERFFREISGRCKSFTAFRWDVGGDVKSFYHFQKMVEVALDNPHCTFHIFTKSYDIVNDWIAANGSLPSNISLRFSEWPGIPMPNPHNLNICRIQMRDKIVEYTEGIALCTGNCSYCGAQGVNCFDSKVRVVVIPEH